MRTRWMWYVTALVLGAGLGAVGPARGADTIAGEVVDLSCYLAHPETSTGASHRKCAETCGKKGLPMGILTDDKRVLLLLEDHDNPSSYGAAVAKGAQRITVEGRTVTQGGMTGIVVEAVK